MSNPGTESRITTLEALAALYGQPSGAAILKEAPRLTVPYRKIIEASPFFSLATSGPGGLDCSPRGDAPGFVRVLDDKTLAIPDRRGNNRTDSLSNIIHDPRVALLFLIPGVSETLRVNGRAEIRIEPELLASFEVNGKLPRSVLVVRIESVYFQCAKSITRSRLWDPASQPVRASLPTAGQMVAAMVSDFDSASYDAAAPARHKAELY